VKNVYTSTKIFNNDYTPFEKDLILTTINSQKFEGEIDLGRRDVKSSRKSACLAESSAKMYNLDVFDNFKIGMVRCLLPTKIECKYLNSRTIINKEFLRFLWHGTNVVIPSTDDSSKNKHLLSCQIEFEDWWVLESEVEIFDLTEDDVESLSAHLKSPKP